MNWLFKSASKDILYILSPLILGIIFCFAVGKYEFAWFTLVVLVIDQTHVASTSWRTIFNKRQSKLLNFGVPLTVLIVISLLITVKFVYLWSVVGYIALVHLIRQNYGILRWYHKANHYFDKMDEIFFYLFSIMPLLFFHFRPDVVLKPFEDGTMINIPSLAIFEIGMAFYLTSLIIWFAFELLIRKQFKRCIGSKVFIFVNSLFMYFALTRLNSNAMIVDIFLMCHGVHYLALNLLTVKKLSHPRPWVYVTILAMGLGLCWIYEYFPSPLDGVNLELNPSTFGVGLLAAIYYLPVLSHYTYDTFIWRSSSVDAKEIYN